MMPLSGKERVMNGKVIPDIIVGRLPIYLLALQHMLDEGRQVTSSQELGERLGISSAQIRKDLSQFGEFGKQGTGYNITYLSDQLRKILKLDRVWDVALVGVGDIGHAVAGYAGFKNRGFRISMVFDNDPQKVGQKAHGFEIQDISNLVDTIRNAGIRVALITTPAVAAQEVADLLIKGGVQAIVNYAPITLNVPGNVRVEYIDPLIHLQRMTYYLNE